MSSSESMETPTLPDFAECERIVGVETDLRGQVERDAEAFHTLRKQVAIALIRFGGAAEAGVLARGPRAAAVHRGIDAARERELARVADVALGVEAVGGEDRRE